MNLEGLKYLVVGSGLWGAVFAERIASVLNERVLVIDKRPNTGGNSYSEYNMETGIECHKYGSHIFHTNSEQVWNYINQFTMFNNYKHRVLTTYKNKVYPMPISLATINMFYNKNLKPFEAEEFIRKERVTYSGGAKNLEEKAISLIGKPLYEAFIKGYTKKQWNRLPVDLSAEIITRLPVRKNFNTNYFSDKFEGIPSQGYAEMFKNILSHKNIEVFLNTDFIDIKDLVPQDCKIIYTGEVDKLFNYKFGELEWRSLQFEWKNLDVNDYQGTSVMNYGDEDIPYTRIHEFKHYHCERKEIYESHKTSICIEYPKSFSKGAEAFYPVNNIRNNEIYSLYKKEASKNFNLILGGRLGAYKYWDMDKAIENALMTFENIRQSTQGCLNK